MQDEPSIIVPQCPSELQKPAQHVLDALFAGEQEDAFTLQGWLQMPLSQAYGEQQSGVVVQDWPLFEHAHEP